MKLLTAQPPRCARNTTFFKVTRSFYRVFAGIGERTHGARYIYRHQHMNEDHIKSVKITKITAQLADIHLQDLRRVIMLEPTSSRGSLSAESQHQHFPLSAVVFLRLSHEDSCRVNASAAHRAHTPVPRLLQHRNLNGHRDPHVVFSLGHRYVRTLMYMTTIEVYFVSTMQITSQVLPSKNRHFQTRSPGRPMGCQFWSSIFDGRETQRSSGATRNKKTQVW